MEEIKLNIKKKPVVMIATPSHDHKMNVCHAVSICNLLIKRPFQMQQYIPGQSGITKARNHSAWNFRNQFKEGTHLMFIDSDIEFYPEMVEQLLDLDLPVVGGLYAHKTDALRWCLNIARPEGVNEGEEVEPYKEGPLKGLIPVRTVGTGFMLIKREVFDTLVEKFGPELEYIEDQESDGGATPKGAKSYAFFQERVVNGRLLTEDWFFCNLCERAGIPMYVDCRFHTLHEGMTRYPLKQYRGYPWVTPSENK